MKYSTLFHPTLVLCVPSRYQSVLCAMILVFMLFLICGVCRLVTVCTLTPYFGSCSSGHQLLLLRQIACILCCVVAVLVSGGLEQFYSQIFLSPYPIYISHFAFFFWISSVDYAVSKRGQSRVCLYHMCQSVFRNKVFGNYIFRILRF